MLTLRCPRSVVGLALFLVSCGNTITSPPVSPLLAAQTAAKQGQLRVTLVEDSIGEGANIDPAHSWAKQLGEALEKAVPGTALHNRALGARYSGHYLNPEYRGMASDPTDLNTGYGWRNPYDTGRGWIKVGQSWRDAVRETAPNLLIVQFGMNEVWLGNTDEEVIERWRVRLNTLLSDVATWKPAPSVVLMTPMLPSATAPEGFAVIPQSRILGIAQVMRETAAERNLYLADITLAWQKSPLSEKEKLGTWPGTWNGVEGGGNGYNHPTQRAHDEIFMPVLRQLIQELQ